MVAPLRHRLDRGTAGADEIRAMAKLGEDGVEQDATVRIVLRAQNRERAHRRAKRRGAVGRRRAGCFGNFVHGHGEAKPAATARFAGHGQIAPHGFGNPLDEGETESGAAVAARDGLVSLRERSKQPLDLELR